MNKQKKKKKPKNSKTVSEFMWVQNQFIYNNKTGIFFFLGENQSPSANSQIQEKYPFLDFYYF